MNTNPRNASVSLGRNDPCSCGSGKKYKKCCRTTRAESHTAPAALLSAVDLNQLATLAKSGRYAALEVAARELIAQNPNGGLLWKFLGLALWSLRKDATAAMRRAAELLPNDAEAHGNLGNALRACGQLEGALQSHRRALTIDPGYAEAHNNLGSVLQDLGCLEEAADCFRRAVDLKPGFALAHGNLGNVLSLLNRHEESETSCRRALDLNPTHTAAMVQLAENLAVRGRFDAAENLLRCAIAIEPDMPEALAGLVRWRRLSSGDSAWLTAAQRAIGNCLAPRREIPLRYAIGKYFDDLADYDQAFANYRYANELAKVGRRLHDRGKFTAGVERIIQTFDGGWLSRASSMANGSQRPVLIVGMPRSGTTLAEQILDSHAAVFGAGELPFWHRAASRYLDARGDADDVGVLRQLAHEYLTAYDPVSGGAARVVDKMPANFLYLGLIHAALPQAKIIHMQRHPIDTCLSIYFQNFDAKHSYANDLDDLTHYYREYLRVMSHWRRSLPVDALLEVPYEGLVEDAEGWSRRMVEFIGLPWDPHCLEFHRNERIVATASTWQARQKINGFSVERWRHYERFVGPLRALVDDAEGS